VWQRGYLTIGRALGAPVRMHWTTPLGAWILGRGHAAGVLGFVVIVLVHELGHAAVSSPFTNLREA
jgi:hypothetical protein